MKRKLITWVVLISALVFMIGSTAVGSSTIALAQSTSNPKLEKAVIDVGSEQTSSETLNTTVGGPITSDTTWTAANSPYIATSSVLVGTGVTLTIEPGVTVRFDAEKALQVDGTLLALGTQAAPIELTANSDDPTPGFWGYVGFRDNSSDAVFDGGGTYVSGSALHYVTVEYAGYASNMFEKSAAIQIEKSSPWIDNSTIWHNQSVGIRADNTSLRFTNNTVAHNGGNGIVVLNEYDGGGGDVLIDGNHLFDNIGNSGASAHPFDLGGGGIAISENTQAGGGTITNNVVEYNYTDWTGGGIYFENNTIDDPVFGGIVAKVGLVADNIVANNLAVTVGGVYVDGDVDVVNNKIYGNVAYDSAVNCASFCEVFRSGGGGLFVDGLGENVNNNIIADNQTLVGSGGGLVLSTWSKAFSLESNIVANNMSAEAAGGIDFGVLIEAPQENSAFRATIQNNSIVNNSAKDFAGVRFGALVEGPVDFNYNTLAGNDASSLSDFANTSICVACFDDDPVLGPIVEHETYGDKVWYSFNQNNLQDPLSTSTLTYGFTPDAPNLDATSNWWGSADSAQINNLIYDFFDDSDIAIVDYANQLTAPNNDAPPSPPINLQGSVSNGAFLLTWSANLETDIAGYKIHYSDKSGYPYEGSGADQGASGIDVGNTTSTSLSGLSQNQYYYFTVSAYDQDGNESWYAQQLKLSDGTVEALSNSGFESGRGIGWETTDGAAIVMSAALPDGIEPLNGDFVAMVGWANDHLAEMSQSFRVPDEGGILNYNYALWAIRSHTNNLCRFGTVEVRIDGDVVHDFSDHALHPSYASWTQTAANCVDTLPFGWITRQIDLAAYAGQIIELSFEVNPASGNLLILDDVELIGYAAPSSYSPSFASEHPIGSPGSIFAFEGTGFPPERRLTARINGIELPIYPDLDPRNFPVAPAWHGESDNWVWPSSAVPLKLNTVGVPDGEYVMEVSAESLTATVSKTFTFTVDSSALEVPYGGFLYDYYAIDIPANINDPALLESNFSSGAAGSYFNLSASNFPANSDAEISVNGDVLEALSTNAAGELEFTLFASSAVYAGFYEVEVALIDANTGNTVRSIITIEIDDTQPVRPKSGSATIINIPEADPALTINYTTGAPGSYFSIEGTDYPPESMLNVFANSTQIGSVETNLLGSFLVIIATDNADEGNYAISFERQQQQQSRLAEQRTGDVFTQFELDADAALRAKEDDGDAAAVPSGIAATQYHVYLPTLIRD